MNRTAIALAALTLALTACTPEQLATLGVAPDHPMYQQALALDDHPIRRHDGTVVELDGSVTPAPPPPAGYVHPWATVQRWHATALDAGWRADEWPWVSCVIRRESGGDPSAYNGRDPAGGSRGLLQINGSNVAWLRARGILNEANDLYNAWTNLRAGRELYRVYGARPWGGACR